VEPASVRNARPGNLATRVTAVARLAAPEPTPHRLLAPPAPCVAPGATAPPRQPRVCPAVLDGIKIRRVSQAAKNAKPATRVRVLDRAAVIFARLGPSLLPLRRPLVRSAAAEPSAMPVTPPVPNVLQDTMRQMMERPPVIAALLESTQQPLRPRVLIALWVNLATAKGAASVGTALLAQSVILSARRLALLVVLENIVEVQLACVAIVSQESVLPLERARA